MEYLWTFENTDGLDADGDDIYGEDRCTDIERDLWLHIGNYTWKKNRSVFDDHMKYVNNDINNIYRVKILHYYDTTHEIYELYQYLYPPRKMVRSIMRPNRNPGTGHLPRMISARIIWIIFRLQQYMIPKKSKMTIYILNMNFGKKYYQP